MIQYTGHYVDSEKLYEAFKDAEIKRQNECVETGIEILNAKMIIDGLNACIVTKSIVDVGTTIQVSIPRK